MTKKNLTHICLILDRSGSMGLIRSDVIGGVNAFLKEQRETPGDCTITLVQFDSQDPYQTIYDHVPVKDTKDIGEEYHPRASTPLLDAMGRGIVNTGTKLESLPEHERPGHVVFVTMTDGLENSSREYTAAKVAEMTKHQEEKYGWKFLYLGANQDAIAVGAGIGVRSVNAANYSPDKFGQAIRTSSKKMAEYRTSGGLSAALDFSDDERKAMS